MPERRKKNNAKTTTGKKAASKAKPKKKPEPSPSARTLASLREQLEEKVAEITKTNRQLKRKIFDLYTIFEISRNFNAVLDYQNLLDTFIFTCLGQVGTLKGSIFLKRNVWDDKFYPAKSKGSGDLPDSDAFFVENTRLTKYLASLNRPIPIEDVITDFASKDERAILALFKPGLIVPLIFQTHLTGIFLMSEKLSGREFKNDDIEFLSILGNQISVAIENARLYESEKKATQQLRSAQQQLVQTEKIAALGEMSAKVAHEVNNPLGIIKNYLVLLQREIAEGNKSREFISVISEEINRIATIVKQLLDFHRPTVNFQRVDILKLIDEITSLMERQLATSNIKLIRKYPEKSPTIMGSPDNLKQVFLNLIINSRDVLEKGGEITVEVEPVNGELHINFIDTGPGIPAENISRIFEPFFTTKELGKGTGLGLSVCYGIIKNHNGSITFRNMNPGSCFEIHLPLVADTAS